MADIIRSTADTSGFIPQYWANRALDVLRQQIVLAQVVAKDVDFGEVGWKGKTITVPYPGTFAPVDKVEGTPITPQAPTGGTSIPLTLNKHKVVGVLVEDFANAQSSQSLMDRYTEPAMISIAEQFESDLWNTAAGVGSALTARGTGGTDLTAAVSRGAMSDLNKAKAPQANRSLVVSPKDQAALLGDSTLATYFAFSQADAIRNGYFGSLYGFDVYWSGLAPTAQAFGVAAVTGTYTFGGQTTSSLTASTLTAAALQTALAGLSSVGAGNVGVTGPTGGPFNVVFGIAGTLTASASTITAGTSNIALHKNAVMYACRPFAPTPADAGVSTAIANDPESGLSIRVSSQYDINNAGMRVNFDILYGMTVLRANQAVSILT